MFRINKLIKLAFCLFLIICSVFVLVGCKEEDPIINKPITMELVSEDNLVLNTFSSSKIEVKFENIENPRLRYEVSEPDVLYIENDVIFTKNTGGAFIEIFLEGHSEVESLVVSVEVIATTQYIDLYVGDTYQVEALNDYASDYDMSGYKYISLSDDGLITALEEGSATVCILSALDSSVIKEYNITIKIPDVKSIESEDLVELEMDVNHQLVWEVLPKYCINDVKIENSNDTICTVSKDGLVHTIMPGTSVVTITSLEDESIFKEITIKVNGDLASSIEIVDNVEITLGQAIDFDYEIIPSGAYQKIEYTIDDETGIKLTDDKKLVGMKIGVFNITLKTVDGSNIKKEVKVEVVAGEEELLFAYEENFENDLTLNWNTHFNVKEGIEAYDAIDGCLTNNIVIDGSVNTRIRGEYEVTYSITNSREETLTFSRVIKVIWPHSVNFVGHMGSYYGGANSEEAILYAARDLNYQAIEIDVKQTKDGVFVLCHDPKFGNYDLESYTWEQLKDVEVTETRKSGLAGDTVIGSGKYTYKLCTLERYLEICKQYGVTAVIELKTSTGISNWTELNSPQNSRMPALIKVIEDAGMINNTILLTSQYMCLAWTRKNGYNFIPCQYLVSSCENQEYLDICKEYDLDISFNVRDNTQNSDEWINKYREIGCKIAVYTFEQYASYAEVQTWIDKGVDYVTTDWHDMSKFSFDNE